MNNPLLDKDFLSRLDSNRERELYAKIVALSFDETPIEEIEGKIVPGGSINIDGNSAVRRSCSLTLVAQDVNIHDFYWSVKTKFKLFLGLKNTIDNNYPDIIWFPQGTLVISSFSVTHNVSSVNISIQGKDKMSLLNGELGGNIVEASVDFGTIEEYDKDKKITKKIHLPIKDIIREAVHQYAKEPWYNIIINDLDECGVELLDYRGTDPMYLFISANEDDDTYQVTNITMNAQQPVYVNGEACVISDSSKIIYDPRIELNLTGNSIIPTTVKLDPNKDSVYTVAKAEYGQTVGYRLTDLVYPGDLILNAGTPVTAVLDAIKKMLGDFEYFYDIDGRFIFQKKKTYITKSFNNIVDNRDETYVDNAALTSATTYQFEGNDLISSISRNPQLTSIKNDYALWGVRKSTTDKELPIHLRYAIDRKPYEYHSISISQEESEELSNQYHLNIPPRESIVYKATEIDWRELIYQMALDYRKFNHWDKFLMKVKEANTISVDGKPYYIYPIGYTGYEQYYIDMEGFWRQLYDPDNKEWEDHWNPLIKTSPESLNFWIDFIDADNDSVLSKYSIPVIGDRAKVINDNKIKSIYFRETPTVIFTNTGSN